jgi:hypothetical protein
MSDEALDRVETLAKIGASLLGVQFEAVEIGGADVAGDPFVHGYCFGLFDAMAQCAKLDQYTDGAAVISEGLSKLVGDRKAGADLFAKAMDLMDAPAFSKGYESGAAELMAWAKDANALPKGIARRGKKGA